MVLEYFSPSKKRPKLSVEKSALFPSSNNKLTRSSFLRPLTGRWNMYVKALQNQLLYKQPCGTGTAARNS